jgi:hypothetical protein
VRVGRHLQNRGAGRRRDQLAATRSLMGAGGRFSFSECTRRVCNWIQCAFYLVGGEPA